MICLPEAAHDFLRDSHHGIWSDPDHGYPVQPDRSKVTLWSRWPWRDLDVVGDARLPPGRYVAGTTSTPLGELRVVGVCIPWRSAHVSTGARNRAPWEEHRTYLERLAGLLERERRRGPVLLMGDLNQRLPRRLAPEDLAAKLQVALRGFDVWTAGTVSGLDQQLLCHIAASALSPTPGSLRGLSRRIAAREVSDHDGVRVGLSVSGVLAPSD